MAQRKTAMPDTTKDSNVIDNSLQSIPFFRSLSAGTRHEISARLQYVQLEHGHVVFAEGSLGDALYVIESGQVKVSINTGPVNGPGSAPQEKVINYLGPGNFFGEMALILDQRRSATVTVTIDADLWVLHKADLDDLLVENPEIALQITRELSRRLSDSFSVAAQRVGHRLTVVFGGAVWRLAQSIRTITHQKVVVFDATEQQLADQLALDEQSDELVVLEANPNFTSDDLVETLGILADGYDWVLVALSPQYNDVRAKAVQVASAMALCNVEPQEWMSTPVSRADVHL
jgi:CRP-like cAMP-binding protein